MRRFKLIKKYKIGYVHVIPILIAIILVMILLLGNKSIYKHLLGSVYSINNIEENIDRLRPGDSIDYEINGYNDWQVLRIDKYNGTIDVVSKSNVEDITFTQDNVQEAEDIFQETANKYTDDKYAVSARGVNFDDISEFAYEEDFWVSPKSENVINSTSGEVDLSPPKNYKFYVIPEIRIADEDGYNYNLGDTYQYSDNGIDEWILVQRNHYDQLFLYLIPSHPIELEINDLNTDIDEAAQEIINSFQQDGVYQLYYSPDREYLYKILGQEDERVNIYSTEYSTGTEHNYYHTENEIKCNHNCLYYDKGNSNYESNYTVYTKAAKSETMGFRPVVTLKYGKKTEGREIDDKLEVGDYVKYSAKDYNSWRVLSINDGDDTVDIISAGVVKNINLSGKDGYDNITKILNDEANNYKVGDNAISARSVNKEDTEIISKMKKNYAVSYWVDDKKENSNKESISYDVGVIDYGAFSTANSTSGEYVTFKYIHLIYIEKEGERYGIIYPRRENTYQYTAGVKPVITLKKSEVEKLTEEEIKKNEASDIKYNRVIAREQSTNNKEYNAKYNGNEEKDFTSSSTKYESENSNIVKEEDNNNQLKYVIILLSVLCILFIAQLVIDVLILKKIK